MRSRQIGQRAVSDCTPDESATAIEAGAEAGAPPRDEGGDAAAPR